jgi:NADH:ubiquinone oxidoreductase subunit F (NADH-binding)
MSAAAAGVVATVSARRLLAGIHEDRAVSLREHLARHGALEIARGATLSQLVEASGLQGRGGAAFPVARKLAAVRARRGRPVVVVNATEGEPLSGKDKVLLRHVPHLVLDGAVALAAELRTADVVVAVSRNAHDERSALVAAVNERKTHRVDRRADINVVTVPDRFVAGEETALVQHLNGAPAQPTLVPPRPFERGVDGRPTLVQNAETVAHVALIARHGPSWFRRVGTPAEPGSALFTVSGSVRRPGVYEAGLGIPLVELIELAGGLAKTPQAVLVGGYFGTWFSAAAARTLTLDDACLLPRGGSLGARAIAVLADDACGVVETARVARYLAEQSAGQCGPCMHGLAAIAGALERAARPEAVDERQRIARWCAQVDGRGACRHPDGAVRFVASALDVFATEFEAHSVHRRCTSDGALVLPIPRGRR